VTNRRHAVPAVLAAGVLAVATPALAAGAQHGARHVSHATRKGTLITTRRISLGRVLTNSSGRVMYLYARDGRNVSHCTGVCLTLWPRVTSPAKPRAAGGVSGSHLRRITHNQVTYYGHPLYYFTGDKAGKAKGEGVQSFFVVSTSGRAIKPKPAGGGGGPGAATVMTGMTSGANSHEVITASNGHTLYALNSGEPPFLCTTGCRSQWPPLLTQGAPIAAGDTIQADLGTVVRPDGGTQVTYMNYPVYEFTTDGAAGEDNGQKAPGPAGATWYDMEPLYGLDGP
jgi:predicted lipoprotein with Yx(FWY)xxD motif